jgi:hypothetical protein
MSTSSAPEPKHDPERDPKNVPESAPEGKPKSVPEGGPKRGPKAALVFDDPLNRQSSDDTDRGWGDRPGAGGDAADDLRRFLDEKPPHHL